MNNIITTQRADSVYIACNCGCSIVSVFRLSDDKFYLQHYGYSNDDRSDFEFESKEMIEKFISLVIRAYNYVFTEAERAEYRELEIGYIESEKYKECISVTVDTYGEASICKYRKNYMKFKKLHKDVDWVDRKFGIPIESVKYDNCPCDWDLVIGSSCMKEFANRLIDVLLPESRNKFETYIYYEL